MFSRTNATFPLDLVPKITEHLDLKFRLSLARTCPFFYNAIKPVELWQKQLIALGCPTEAVMGLNNIQNLEINYSFLYCNLKKIAHSGTKHLLDIGKQMILQSITHSAQESMQIKFGTALSKRIIFSIYPTYYSQYIQIPLGSYYA